MTTFVLLPTDLLSSELDDLAYGDALVQRRIISFGTLPPLSCRALRTEKIEGYQQRIHGWIGEEGERLKSLADYRHHHDALQEAAAQTQAIVTVDALPLMADHVASLIARREKSLLAEAHLQVYEGALGTADLAHLQQGIAALDLLAGPIRVAEPCVVVEQATYAMAGLLIFTTQSGLDQPERDEWVLLFVPGAGGGLQKFASLHNLLDQVLFTLQSEFDTPFWRHVPAVSRSAVMEAAKAGTLTLVARTVTSPVMTHSVHAQVTDLQAASLASAGGLRFFADAAGHPETLKRLQLEACDSLNVHANEARDQAIDRIAQLQRTSALASQIPAWLLQAPLDVRREYAQQLNQYHGAAALLEQSLEQVLPSLGVFTRQTLNQRIHTDLGAEVNTDKVFLELPERVTRELDIDPQLGMLKHGGTWIPSPLRVRFSLTELARQNIDPNDAEMKARLTFARIDLPADALAIQAGLTAAYVAQIIPELDVADQYRALLQRVFETRAAQSPLIETECLLRPYELDILLDGFACLQRRLISARAYQVLQLAVHARNNADLRVAQLQLSWVALKPGHSVSGDTDSATLGGLCVIHHVPTAVTLIYLPQSVDGVSLIEANSLQSAKAKLINKLNAQPPLVGYLASRVLDERRRESDQRYINEALKAKFDGFIEFTPGLFLQIAAQQVHARAGLIYEQSKHEARSNDDIHIEHSLRKNQAYMGYFKALLSFLPGLGTLISLHDGWNEGHAAAKALAQGKKFEAEKLTASTALSVLDVLLSVVPGIATAAVIARTARHTTKLSRALRAAEVLPSVTGKRYVLTPFDGYKVQNSLLDAVKMHGADAGTYFKNGELWIQRQGQHYAVYRRLGEKTLRLKKTTNQGYEPPIRLDAQGDWVYHTDVGLRGGIRSSIAETLISETHPDPAFTRRQARGLLDQFDFPINQQRRLELDVAVHFQGHRAVPEWAEAYRRLPRATSVGPTAPELSGTKRKQPPADRAETDRQPPQPVAGPSAAHGSTAIARKDAWKSWGRTFDVANGPELIKTQPPVYRLPGSEAQSAVKIGDQYYAILPDGSSPHPTIVFLYKPLARPSQGSFSELNEAIRLNLYDQPLMASIANGQWTVHGPLFSDRIQYLIGQIRPGFTPISQRVMAEKLYQMADTPGQTLTATRLMNIKATLNAWRKGGAAPIARLDDPLDMLDGARPVTAPTHQVLSISYESALDNFQRLDFLPGDPADVALLRAAGSDSLSAIELRELVERQLVVAGYQLLPEGDLMYWQPNLVFRRPGLDKLYVLNVRRVYHSQLLHKIPSLEAEFPLSSAWLDELQRRYAHLPITTTIASARDQGKLVRLIGGINRKSTSSAHTQLFVIRVADDV